jgi:beta-glucosidase
MAKKSATRKSVKSQPESVPAAKSTSKKTTQKVARKVAKKVVRQAAKKNAHAAAAPRAAATRDFPRDFLWGTATSATQVDGGDRASDWYHFCQQPGAILDGSSCEVACDHWNRYEADYALMRRLDLNAYRFGVDWSRFQPAAGAPFDTAALDHVRAMLGSLKRKRIRPLLTLHHFTLPQWWLERGGFAREENLGEFYAYARFIVEGLGDLVEDYITINEPNVYALEAYIMEHWPPARGGISGFLESNKVQRNLVLAHFQLYDMIHEVHGRKGYATPKVSIAKHMRLMDPLNPDRNLDVDRARSADWRVNRVVSDCIHSGRLLAPLGRGQQIHDPVAWDFFGLNYYSREMVSFALSKPHLLFIHNETRAGAPLNDLGWEIYPDGLYRLLRDLDERYGLPIRITENGTADSRDAFRGEYIREHLLAVRRAMQEGVRVEGYYHWSFMDNFEWAEGYSARFGLVEVDFATQKRTVRPSGKLYQQIARTGKIPHNVTY